MQDTIRETVDAQAATTQAATNEEANSEQITYGYRNPILVYIFEVTNIVGCFLYSFLLLFNLGGLVLPKSVSSMEELLVCLKTLLVLSILFVVFVGVPLLLLFYDSFVIMKGVRHFKMSVLSILMLPGAYPIIRTKVLKEESKTRTLHIVCGTLVIISNILVIVALIYYMIRITIFLNRMMGI